MAARKPEHIKALYVEAKGKSESALLWLGVNLMHREHKSIPWTGKALRERREYLKLNTAELAEKIGTHESQIHDLEQGCIGMDIDNNTVHALLVDALQLEREVIDATMLMDLHGVDADTAFFLGAVIRGEAPFGWGMYG